MVHSIKILSLCMSWHQVLHDQSELGGCPSDKHVTFRGRLEQKLAVCLGKGMLRLPVRSIKKALAKFLLVPTKSECYCDRQHTVALKAVPKSA